MKTWTPLAIALAVSMLPSAAGKAQTPIRIEVRLLSAKESVLQGSGITWKTRAGVTACLLDDAGLTRLMYRCQEDQHSHITQFPRFSLDDGQTSKSEFMDTITAVTDLDVSFEKGKKRFRPRSEMIRAGVAATVCPKVLANGDVAVDFKFLSRQVELVKSDSHHKVAVARNDRLETTTLQLETPKIEEHKIENRLTIPRDRTLALHLGTTRQMVAETVPIGVLGDLPYIGHWFTRTEYPYEQMPFVVLVSVKVGDGEPVGEFQIDPLPDDSKVKLVR